MQPPITRYKDEIPEVKAEPSANDIINQQLDKEAENIKHQDEKLKVIPVIKSEKKVTSGSSIVNAFRQKMANNTTSIDIPSIGKSVEFKAISAAEQKELSKVAMENDSRADIMYCAMLAMVNKLAVEKGFDIRDYSEFERIAITLNLQQMNKMNPEIKFTCQKCGKENSYVLDTQQLLRKFNKTYKPDEEITVEVGSKRFTWTIGWASVKSVEDFFKNYYRKYDNASKSVKETINNLSQVEYIAMFIKKITITEISDPDDTMTADLNQLTYAERTQILDCLPQNIVFDDETGIISKIISDYITPMNNCFKYNDCSFCGAEQDGQMANVTDFIAGQ